MFAVAGENSDNNQNEASRYNFHYIILSLQYIQIYPWEAWATLKQRKKTGETLRHTHTH